MEQVGHLGSGMYGDDAPWLTLGTINVILTRLGSDVGVSSRVMSVVGGFNLEARNQAPKRARVMATLFLGFFKEDKEGTFQPYNNALVVTLRIGGYDVKRVIINQGSEVEIMYLDLYRGLKLKPEDLERYDSPLMVFNGRIVIP